MTGFRRRRAEKHMHYYIREPTDATDEAPLVFVHGVGMGLATYISFILALVRSVGSVRRILLIELPHVSMKLGREDVPSMDTVLQTAAAIFKQHGLAPALWVR